MALIDDWHIYLKDPASFPKDHFEPMVTDTGTPLNLADAFGSLPGGRELISRIEQVRRETVFTGLYHIQDPARQLSAQDLEHKARKYCDYVSDFLRDINEPDLARSVDSSAFGYLYVGGYDFRDKDGTLGLNGAEEIIDDELTYAIADGPHWLKGLFQAVLFMTKVPVVTRYVMASVVNLPFKEAQGYEVWIGGAQMIFGNSLNYLVIPPSKSTG